MRIKHYVPAAVPALVLCLSANAAVELVSPVDGAEVALLPEAQKKIMSLATYGERLAALRADGEKPHDERYYGRGRSEKWRTSVPLRLTWRTTDGEGAPWRILLGTSPDLADAAEIWLNPGEASKMATTKDSSTSEKVEGNVHIYTHTMPRANLELGRKYYWKVWSDVKCPVYSHGSTLKGPCSCGKGRAATASAVGAFVTEGQPPRWIKVEGTVGNIRDLGGWKTLDGRSVKQGMIFRGQGLNENSVSGDKPGRNRLTVEDVNYLKNVLGIKTDLDLRTDREVSTMRESPLGAGVKFIQNASPAYNGLFAKGGFNDQLCSESMKITAKNFRVFCDRANYPVYFHCIGGADRTGSLAYILNGILGVPKHALEVDWEATFYPLLPELESGYTGKDYWRREQYFDEGFSKYGDADTPWNKRIELYLLDCGVTKEEIARFRSIMLD
ncbi:MAG: tyrosine-protein phosphatase [Kiritimatiellae bacterium]|nr:tyrosine-protein phosphatase [Kiritimatiellia bacterium]